MGQVTTKEVFLKGATQFSSKSIYAMTKQIM